MHGPQKLFPFFYILIIEKFDKLQVIWNKIICFLRTVNIDASGDHGEDDFRDALAWNSHLPVNTTESLNVRQSVQGWNIKGARGWIIHDRVCSLHRFLSLSFAPSSEMCASVCSPWKNFSTPFYAPSLQITSGLPCI